MLQFLKNFSKNEFPEFGGGRESVRPDGRGDHLPQEKTAPAVMEGARDFLLTGQYHPDRLFYDDMRFPGSGARQIQ